MASFADFAEKVLVDYSPKENVYVEKLENELLCSCSVFDWG